MTAARGVRTDEEWWATVTPDELARSGALVAALLDPTIVGPLDPAVAARALAIRQLCVDAAAIADALAEATARTRSDERSIRDGGDTRAAKAWLAHCELLGGIFATTLGLLAPRDVAAGKEQLREFDAAVGRLRGDLIAIAMRGGIRGGVRPSRRLTLRRDER